MRKLVAALAVAVLLAAAAAQAAPPADAKAAAPAAGDQAQATARKGDITPDAAAAVKAMCDFLKAQPVLSFTAELSQEEVYPSGQTLQVNRIAEIVLKRPDKLYARITGDDRDRVFVYDGKTVTVADLDKGVYAVLAAPPTVDAMLDMLTGQYGLNAPASDLLYADPCASLLDNVQVGDLVGTHLAAGKACRHLAFTQKNADWQLWIENGRQPLPRKLVINDKERMGWPQYAVTLLEYDFHPRLPSGLFTFVPAKNARQIDFIPLGSVPGGEK